MVQLVWQPKIPLPSGGRNEILYGQHQRHGTEVYIVNYLTVLLCLPFRPCILTSTIQKDRLRVGLGGGR